MTDYRDQVMSIGLGELADTMGIEVLEATAERFVARMPVHGNRQPTHPGEVGVYSASAMLLDANDPAKGRQMPDHYCFREAKVTSISSPIGTQITPDV